MTILNFLHNTHYDDIPETAIKFAKRCLLDLVGVAAAGSRTQLSRIICDHAKMHFGTAGFGATILFDGQRISPAGAALANGMMIDSIDAHDGYKPSKGHVGCHVLPALLAFDQAHRNGSGKDFLTDLVVGYEIGSRAGEALHSSVADYHTSGAWGAVTAAALGARIFGLDAGHTRHAIGIGEYHGPRSQMMRVIDHPTMLKDGSGWGAMAGVSAAYLAASGFTGAPAVSVEAENVAQFWEDLGENWLIEEQYFKPYPVCRWAQPATAAALALSREHGFEHSDIKEIEVFSFHEACRLATRTPADTEQAQYSLPFPVAAALVFGEIGPAEIDGHNLTDQRVLRLSETMQLTEFDAYNQAFPQERYAHVQVMLNDGRILKSERHQAVGDPDTPLSDEDIILKFHSLADPVLGESRARTIRELVEHLDEAEQASSLINELMQPLEPVTA